MRQKIWLGGLYLVLLVLSWGWIHERQLAANALSERNDLQRKLEELESNITNPLIMPSAQQQMTSTRMDFYPTLPGHSVEEVKQSSNEVVAGVSQSGSNALAGQTPPIRPQEQITSVSAAFTQDKPQSPYTQQQLELYRCSNQLLTINMAIERWAAAHNGKIPNDLLELQNFLAPMTLVCPSAQPGSLATSWRNFDVKDITYQIKASAAGAYWDFQIAGRSSPVTKDCLICPIHKIHTFNRVQSAGIPLDQVSYPGYGQ